jgi:tetratricopeptide (TPR) repeat protein
MTALSRLGHLYFRRGDFDATMAVLERARALCETWGISLFSSWIAARLGAAYSLAGRGDEGQPLLQEALMNDAPAGTVRGARWPAWRSEVLLLLGRTADAADQARRALDLASERRERGHQARALLLLAESATCPEQFEPQQADTSFRNALGLAEELGMRPLQAHCHLGLGKLYRQIGRPDEARAELSTAATMLREMGMSFWLPEAEGGLNAARAAPVD